MTLIFKFEYTKYLPKGFCKVIPKGGKYFMSFLLAKLFHLEFNFLFYFKYDYLNIKFIYLSFEEQISIKISFFLLSLIHLMKK